MSFASISPGRGAPTGWSSAGPTRTSATATPGSATTSSFAATWKRSPASTWASSSCVPPARRGWWSSRGRAKPSPRCRAGSHARASPPTPAPSGTTVAGIGSYPSPEPGRLARLQVEVDQRRALLLAGDEDDRALGDPDGQRLRAVDEVAVVAELAVNVDRQ